MEDVWIHAGGRMWRKEGRRGAPPRRGGFGNAVGAGGEHRQSAKAMADVATEPTEATWPPTWVGLANRRISHTRVAITV